MTRALITAAACLVLALAFAARVMPALEHVFREPVAPGVDGSAVDERRPAEVRFFDVDSWYHLRHARLAAEQFPRLHRHDLWVNYPLGYRAPELGLYALTMAGVAVVVSGGRDVSEDVLRRVVAWTPPVLGAAAFAALMLLAGTLWGPLAGLLAGSLLLAYPGTFLARSLLGFSDHHVAEVLLLLLVMLGVVHSLPRGAAAPQAIRRAAAARHVRRSSRGSTPAVPVRQVSTAPEGEATRTLPPAWWRPAFIAALPLAVFHFTWNGAPVYLFLTGLAFFGACVIGLARGHEVGMAVAGFRYWAAFLLITGVTGLLAPELVQVPDVFPRVLVLGTLMALAFPAYFLPVGRWVRRSGTDSRVVAIVTLVVAVCGLAAYLALTGEGQWIWRTLTDARTPLIREHDATLDLTTYLQHAAVPGLIALAAPIVAIGVIRRGVGVAWLPPLILASLTMLLWIATGDFGYMAAPCAALLATFVLVEGVAPLLQRLLRPRVRVALAAAGLAVLLLAPVFGRAGPGRPWPAQADLDGLMLYNDGWAQALEWLALNTPEPWLDGGTDPGTAPAGRVGTADGARASYGVMAAWDFGNFITAVARRPVLWSQGLDPRSSAWLLAPGEAEASGVLAGLPGDFRYFVVDARTVGDMFAAKAIGNGIPESRLRQPIGDVEVRGRRVPLTTYGNTFEHSMAHRLYYGDGTEVEQYRQIYRSPHRSLTAYVVRPREGGTTVSRVARALDSPDDEAEAMRLAENPAFVVDYGARGVMFLSRVEPTVKVFERVAGAVLTGQAPPGATVLAVLRLHSPSDDALIEYRRTGTAGGDGRFALRVPYATAPRAARPVGVYAITPYQVFLLDTAAGAAPGSAAAARAHLIVDGIRVTEADVREGRTVPLYRRR